MRPIKQDFFNKMAYKFDSHVRQSIPLYDSVQRFIVQSIVQAGNGTSTVLDLLGSTGAMGRALQRANFDGDYLCVDGSPIMRDAFYSLKPFDAHRLNFELSGFLASWTDVDSDGNDVVIPMFCNYEKFDIVLELLGFQFFTKTREKEVAAAASCMKAGGCFITFEKHSQNPENVDGAEIWNANELIKDNFHKALYFDSEQIDAKKRDVLVDMGEYCVPANEYYRVLRNRFPYVSKFAQIGNFAGYICTNEYSNPVYQYMLSESVNGYFELLQNGFNYPETKARILTQKGLI